MSRLSRLECEILARAADFVLAGEWPWEDEDDFETEVARLERAVENLRARVTPERRSRRPPR